MHTLLLLGFGVQYTLAHRSLTGYHCDYYQKMLRTYRLSYGDLQLVLLQLAGCQLQPSV